MSYDIDKLRESELTDHLKKEEQELSLVDHLREVTEEKKDLERQLEEAREENQYLAKGIQMRDVMVKSLQEECVKLHLQIPVKQLKEKGDESLHRPSLGEYLSEVIKLNFEDVKRTDCCTKTAEWILEKIEQWEKGDEETPT